MRPFLEEIQATLDCGIYSTALVSLLLLPDACGAIEYPNERNNRRYTLWYDNFVRTTLDDRNTLAGVVIWKLRNAMIHETSTNFTDYGFDRIIFSVAKHNSFHMNKTDKWLGWHDDPDGEHKRGITFQLCLHTFAAELLAATERWITNIENDEDQNRISQLNRLVQLRPSGMRPYLSGAPVIG